ncbi:MAG TPA: glycoside hydrolase family 88 protein [Myxococcota bacterium]|nr:glycoside hydrolase family 88 protein [Myxococcota bacterium]HQK51981.1 glycoside hydrolase family 88 protein [Myxococcota bacterium]
MGRWGCLAAAGALLALSCSEGGGLIPPADLPAETLADLPGETPSGTDGGPEAIPEELAGEGTGPEDSGADGDRDPGEEPGDVQEGVEDPGPLPRPASRPFLWVGPEDRERLVGRLGEPLFAGLLTRMRDQAATACEEDLGTEWSPGVHQRNGVRAQAAAVLAWLLGDSEAANRARECLARIRTDVESSSELDVNIRVANGQIPFVVAWDLLAGTDFFPEAEAAEARSRLVRINQAFYDRYVGDDFYRWTALVVTRNNHPIRTASAMGFTALAFPDAPGSQEILEFAVSELDDLFGPRGLYLQPDGVVSEEPFYFGFGAPPALAFFQAMRHVRAQDAVWRDRWWFRRCITHNEADPWGAIPCREDEPFLWADPLDPPGANPHSDLFWKAWDWSLDHRMPSGFRSPTGDGAMRTQNASLWLAALSGRGRHAWDGTHAPGQTVEMTRGLDLTAMHLLALPGDPTPVEPWWTTAFRTTSGHATLRSGWDPDARWILVLGESGNARKTIHDHVDGLSFSLAAYGEYLLIDTGYHKPNPMDNALTAQAGSHNLLLIDGQGAPPKGYLNDFGDTDATMGHAVDGARLDTVEVSQEFQGTRIRRSVWLVRDRYAVVADALQTDRAEARDHAFRVHGWAGHGSGGQVEWQPTGVTFQRERAGVQVALASTAGDPAIQEPDYVPGRPPHVHDILDGPGDHTVMDGVVRDRAPGFLAVLAPWKIGAEPGALEAPLVVTRLASGDGAAAFLVGHSRGTDLLWAREDGAAGRIEAGGHIIETDARLLLLGLDDDLLGMSRGTWVRRDGREIPLQGARRTGESPADSVTVLDPPWDACGLPVADSLDCFRERRDVRSDSVRLALEIARRQMARVSADRLSWDWGPAVMLTAFAELHRATGDPDLLAYLRTWMDRHLQGGHDMLSSDTASPVTVALHLWQVTGEARYRAVVDEFLDYIEEECLRSPEGGLNHLGVNDLLGVTLWLDSLWMVGVPLARLGNVPEYREAGGNGGPLAEAGRQFRVFADLLQDESGLLRHAEGWALPQDPDVFWGRGNGWVLAAGAEYLRQVRLAGAWDDRVQEVLRRLAAAVRAWQDPATGLWWTVLNRPGETYLETSAAALLAFGMARAWRFGMLGDEVLPAIRAAMDGVLTRIRMDPDGPVVTGTSGPTTAGTFAQYAAVPQADDIPYGIGAVVLALLETSGLPLP